MADTTEVIKPEGDYDNKHDVALTPLTLTKYFLSIVLLCFSIAIVGALMFTGNTRVSSETNPWVSLLVCVSKSLEFEFVLLYLSLSSIIIMIVKFFVCAPITYFHALTCYTLRLWPSYGCR